VSDSPERGEKAALLLEGGFASLLEGLEDLHIPCARVLSVAGFLVTMGPFLLGRREYSEGERPPLFAPGPLFSNLADKSVTSARQLVLAMVYTLTAGRRRARATTYLGWEGGI